jgi:hypothetical protein
MSPPPCGVGGVSPSPSSPPLVLGHTFERPDDNLAKAIFPHCAPPGSPTGSEGHTLGHTLTEESVFMRVGSGLRLRLIV